jgi:hypothetical protein
MPGRRMKKAPDATPGPGAAAPGPGASKRYRLKFDGEVVADGVDRSAAIVAMKDRDGRMNVFAAVRLLDLADGLILGERAGWREWDIEPCG